MRECLRFKKGMRMFGLMGILMVVGLLVSNTFAVRAGAEEVADEEKLETLLVEASSAEVLEEMTGVSEVKELTEGTYAVEFENVERAEAAYEELQEVDEVQTVVHDQKLYALTDTEAQVVSDARFQAWGVAKIGADTYSEWLKSQTGTGQVRVAVLDSGINVAHEVFRESATGDRLNLTYAHDYVHGDSWPEDDFGHGTMVAGLVAEATPSNVEIVPVKVLGNDGSGEVSLILEAVADLAPVVDVVNLSLGAKTSDFDPNTLEFAERVFARARNQYGVTIVASAGNEARSEVYYPASSDYTLAVSSVNSSLNFSYGFSNYGEKVDFTMPGENLIVPDYAGSSRYTVASGTSLSAPFLAAAAALVKAGHPGYSWAQVLAELRADARDLGATGWDRFYGYGMVDFTGRDFSNNSDTSGGSSTGGSGGSAGGGASSGDTGAGGGQESSGETNTRSDDGAGSGTGSEQDDTGGGERGGSSTPVVADGIYVIHSALNGRQVLDVESAAVENKANIQLYHQNDTIAQKFIIRNVGGNLYEIENLKSRKLLDVAYGGTVNFTNVWQFQSNSSCAQRWKIQLTREGYYTFVSSCSGLYLDVRAGNSADGANVQLYSGNNTRSQKFSLSLQESIAENRVVEDGVYIIKSALNTRKAVDVAAASTQNEANLHLWDVNGTGAQAFRITYLKDGFYQIVNLNSGKALDAAGAGTVNYTNVQQYAWNGTIAQQWLIKRTSEGYYTLVSRCNLLNLDVAGGRMANGTNIHLYTSNNTGAQKFRLVKV